MSSEDLEESSAPLIEHLAELRNRLMYSVAAWETAIKTAGSC